MTPSALQRTWWRLEAPAGKVLVWSLVVLAYVFLHAPTLVVIGASFSGSSFHGLIEFPPTQLTLERYRHIPASQVRSILLSLELGIVSAAIGIALGVPAALGIVRGNLPGRGLIAAVFRTPLQIPTVVVGITFLQLAYAAGSALGIEVVGSFWALAVGHCFIATPYVIGTVTAVLQRFDVRLEEAAASLGASPWRTFRRVTVPVIMPGIYAGALYAFMVSFGDVPVSMFLTTTELTTYPVEVFNDLEQNFDPSILASGTLVILLCFVLMLIVQRLVGMETLLRTGGSGRR